MGMMSALVWYVVPGLIGRAYDLKNETVGPDLFDVNEALYTKVIKRYTTTSEYRVISDVFEASDFLDVSGKLSLKLKTGAINIEGTGNYLKESTSFKNRIDLLVKVHYETVTLTLPSDIKPLPNWEKIIQGTGNTHYIRSIKYGGDLIASISFITSNEADKELIKGKIQGELHAKYGSFGGGLKGNLENIQKKTKSMASMNIDYFATVPLEDVPRTIDGLTSLVDKFPEQTKKLNDGWGVPLQMEVFSLESLGGSIKTYYQTTAFTYLLNILDEQFTDFRNARSRLNDWMKRTPPVLSDEMNRKISDFATKLDELDRVFSKTIGNLDLSSDASAAQFEPAFEAYQDSEEELYPDMYTNRFLKLKLEVLRSTSAFETDFGGAIFTYWGSEECPAGASQLFNGMMASTNRKSIGSTKFLCLPDKRDYYPDKSESDDYEEDIEDMPQVGPVLYATQKPDKVGYAVNCASCRLPGKTAVTMLPGKSQCPPGWTEQYHGVLVSTDAKSSRGELICIDDENKFKPATKDIENTVITEVVPSCEYEDFPCSSDLSDMRAIACVVCSIKKETKSRGEVHRI